MPKVLVTVEELMKIADYVYHGQIKTLKIRRYKTGTNAGKLYAEYSIKPESHFEHSTLEKRSKVRDLLVTAAKALADGKRIELLVTKRSPNLEEYTHSLSVWGNKT